MGGITKLVFPKSEMFPQFFPRFCFQKVSSRRKEGVSGAFGTFKAVWEEQSKQKMQEFNNVQFGSVRCKQCHLTKKKQVRVKRGLKTKTWTKKLTC